MTTANPYQTPGANLGDGGNDYINLSIFSPKGRLGRIRYLAYSLVFGLAITVVLVALLAMFGGLALLTGDASASTLGAGSLVLVLTCIPVAIASVVIAVFMAIKRLHDIDWSGWLVILMFIPLVNYVMILLLWCVPGTKGPNQHGGQTPPNGTGVTILGLINPVLTVAGIVAAFALPAYLAASMGLPSPSDLEAQAPAYEESAPADSTTPVGEATPVDETSTVTEESTVTETETVTEEAPAEGEATEETSEEAPAEEQPQQ